MRKSKALKGYATLAAKGREYKKTVRKSNKFGSRLLP